MSRKKNLSDELLACQKVLKYISGQEIAVDYLDPVDWKALDLPDYPKIIKTPMDLGTVEKKLNAGKYSSADQFVADVRLVWKNAMTYNRQGSDIYNNAESLSKAFEKRFKEKVTSKSGTSKKRKESTKEVSRQDRVKFSQLINQLASDELGHIVVWIKKECPSAITDDGQDTIEIEINYLSENLLLSLNEYAQQCISKQSSDTKKRKK